MGEDEVAYKSNEELVAQLFQPENAVAVEDSFLGIEKRTIHFEMELQQTDEKRVMITGTLGQSIICPSGAPGRSLPLAITDYKTGLGKDKKTGYNKHCTYGNDGENEPIEMSREVILLASIEDEVARGNYNEAIEDALVRHPLLSEKDKKLGERVDKKLAYPNARLSASVFKKSTRREEAALKCAMLVKNKKLMKPKMNTKERAQLVPLTTAAFYDRAGAKEGERKEAFSFENPKRTRAKEGTKTAKLFGVVEKEGFIFENPMKTVQARLMPSPRRLGTQGAGAHRQQQTPSPGGDKSVGSPGSSTAGLLGVPGGIVGQGQEALKTPSPREGTSSRSAGRIR